MLYAKGGGVSAKKLHSLQKIQPQPPPPHRKVLEVSRSGFLYKARVIKIWIHIHILHSLFKNQQIIYCKKSMYVHLIFSGRTTKRYGKKT